MRQAGVSSAQNARQLQWRKRARTRTRIIHRPMSDSQPRQDRDTKNAFRIENLRFSLHMSKKSSNFVRNFVCGPQMKARRFNMRHS